MPPSETRLPVALSAAISLVKTTVNAVIDRLIVTLGAQVQSCVRAAEREVLFNTHTDLSRKGGLLLTRFSDELNRQVHADLQGRDGPTRRASQQTDWESLTLVDDQEVEEQMVAARLGQGVAHACEWELRELASHMAAVLGWPHADDERSPLRAEVIGMALFRAIEATTSAQESQKILAREFGLAMAQAMPACYREILNNLQARGVKPVSLRLRANDTTSSSGSTHGGATSRTTDFDPHSAHMGTGTGGSGSGSGEHGGRVGRASTAGSVARRGGATSSSTTAADAQLMGLLRRLTALASQPAELDGLASSHGSGGHGSWGASTRPAHAPGATDEAGEGLPPLMAPNLIHAHRDALREASPGQLNHLVIDVVASLFDQILSDSRVPPQMARLMARLQLPVLRVALSDASFFSSRKHPVRRFVNRMASLASAFDAFDVDPGKQFLARAQALVQEIIDGDFDQVDVYTSKLALLEAFIAEQNQSDVELRTGAVSLFEGKESERRVQQLYLLQLRSALSDLPLQPYLRDFLAEVWSQVLAQASRDAARPQDLARFRKVGVDLVMSVQPKGLPALRKAFLMGLPMLMKDLNDGLQRIGWSDAAQKDFFGQLLPAHAESLKGVPPSDLERNLLIKQLEAIFAAPMPDPASRGRSRPELASAPAAEVRLSPEEASRVGLLPDAELQAAPPPAHADVDLDIDLSDDNTTVLADAPLPALTLGVGIDINLDLVTADPAEPTQGAQLIDHIKLGFAYQMHLQGAWQKVRLSYVSPERAFFVFTHGRSQQETLSVTARMLTRMCEAQRVRAVESTYLMERATARARRQLAAIKGNNTRH